MRVNHLHQHQPVQCRDVSGASLERWRHEDIGPVVLELHGNSTFRRVEVGSHTIAQAPIDASGHRHGK